jgi:hypothetical protein
MRHYNAWYNHGDARVVFQLTNSGVCVCEGCGKRPRSGASPYCEMHYYRLRRTGSLDGGNVNAARGVWESSTGYLCTRMNGHPWAAPDGRIYLHRAVFHESFGAGPHKCHWCMKWIKSPKQLNVDHRDGNRKNNSPNNLLPSCLGCNTRRGENWKKNHLPRVSKPIELHGVSKSISQWAREIGIAPRNVVARIKRGWSIERALTEPRGKQGPRAQRQMRLDLA